MTVTDEIELHDSQVVVDCKPDGVVLKLTPAYVHHWECTSGKWRGVGRTQDATIRIASGALSPAVPPGRHTISEGWFRVDAELYDNMIPVPLENTGTVVGRLILVGAEPVDILGASLNVELTGVPKDIEALPNEWAPMPNRPIQPTRDKAARG